MVVESGVLGPVALIPHACVVALLSSEPGARVLLLRLGRSHVGLLAGGAVRQKFGEQLAVVVGETVPRGAVKEVVRRCFRSVPPQGMDLDGLFDLVGKKTIDVEQLVFCDVTAARGGRGASEQLDRGGG